MIPEELRQFPVAAELEAWNADAVLGGKLDRAELTLQIHPQQIEAVCRFLREQQQFNRLALVTGVDWWPVEPRFEVVYQLHSIPRNLRLRLKCRLHGESAEIDSVSPVWPSANWYEREVFDLFGITFRNHPDLRRIMMPEGWEGHPLRKDYPTTGPKYNYQGESQH